LAARVLPVLRATRGFSATPLLADAPPKSAPIGGEHVNTKYRSLHDKQWSQVSGVKHYLYNLDSLAGQLEAIVVEGYMGAPFRESVKD
jgi:hypothetical protein